MCVCVCVRVLPIDEKGMERREERREEEDSERVEVRKGGECVGSRGSLEIVESGLRVFCGVRFVFNCASLRDFFILFFIYTES